MTRMCVTLFSKLKSLLIELYLFLNVFKFVLWKNYDSEKMLQLLLPQNDL